MVTYRIHLIRHGMAEDPEKKICLGCHSDPSLTPDGAEELRQLMDSYQYPFAEKVYCSPLLRCRQPADILFPETEFEIMDELTECDLGSFDGKPITELMENPAFVGWVEGKCPPPGGEKSEEFANRIACAFDDIIHDMSKNHLIETAVVTHGTVIMGLCAMCGYPRQEMRYWASNSGCGYTLSSSVSMWMHDQCFEVISTLPFENRDEDYEEPQLSEEEREWNFFE